MATVVRGDFERDDAKAEANTRKHGVSFDEADERRYRQRQGEPGAPQSGRTKAAHRKALAEVAHARVGAMRRYLVRPTGTGTEHVRGDQP